jgi:hypothetical protein
MEKLHSCNIDITQSKNNNNIHINNSIYNYKNRKRNQVEPFSLPWREMKR